MREKSNGKQCRVVKNGNFTTIHNACLRTKEMSLKAKGLLAVCLSLPDDWDYSIAGLVTLSSDGRDSVTKALNELEKFGFLSIESSRIKGTFARFYTFYENPSDNPLFNKVPTVTDFPIRCSDRDGFSVTVNPMQLCRNGSTVTENPEQLNTNNELNKLNKENQLTLIKTDESVFTGEDLFKLYKSICIHYPQPREFNEERKAKAIKRLKEHASKDFWEVVFRNAEKSLFIRKSSFFSFDWILKNKTNSVKVFEGNYNKQEIKEEPITVNNGGKYSKCYG